MGSKKTTVIKDVSTWDSGGGTTIDVVDLRDGRVIGISDEAVVLYKSMEDLELGDSSEKRPRILL